MKIPRSSPAARSSAPTSTRDIGANDAPHPRRVFFISGQKRGVFGAIKRELRRRSAIKGRAGDAANAILSAVGYNFRRILAWLSMHSDRYSIRLGNGRLFTNPV
jgi:hypothetical protein